ncbi:MAG TPA: hypothetical protein PKV43_03165 [Armatimonadota bacterium]|nr:hypothetical protein [Armatimonadota bacterium]
MTERIVVSLGMFAVVCFAFVVMKLVELRSQERFPAKFWINPYIGMAATGIYVGVDIIAYVLGYWPYSKSFQIGKSVVLWAILLTVIARLFLFIINNRSSTSIDRIIDNKPNE